MDGQQHDLIVRTITEHADSLLRVARRHTQCQADAEDAYQRALEIFVKTAHRLDPATAHRWLHTVVKHESLAVRAQRSKLVGVEDETALDALDDGRHVASVEERSERLSELTRAAEALRRLKPQEVTALVLKAQGLSYREIAERQGWTYTKVNRCITEGRRSFLQRYAGIECGAECERWTPVLSAMADGEATAQQLVDVRPHLRNCLACRSVLAGMQDSGAPVAALLPVGLLGAPAAAGAGAGGGLLDRLAELVLGAQERVVAPLVRAQGGLEAAGAAKVAAVAASTVALAGGGVAIERGAAGDAAARAAERPAVVRDAPAAPPAVPASAAAVAAPDPSGAEVSRRPRPRPAPALARRSARRAPDRDRESPAGQGEFAGATPAPAPPVQAAAPAPAPAPAPASFESGAAAATPAAAPAPASGGGGESAGSAAAEFGFAE